MIDWKEIATGDAWELFARDFLVELGFVVEVEPGRGPDGGRDIVVSEQLRGTLFASKFNWLVSCKHNAQGGTAVGAQEVDIADRCVRNGAQGFMGFYSTMASSGLVDRLKDLKSTGRIEAVEIFDHKKVEAMIAASGMSKLLLRYLPASYGKMRPIQNFFGHYSGLECDICGKDVLTASIAEPFSANLVWSCAVETEAYTKLYVACKGECDHRISERIHRSGNVTHWEDIGDLCNPILYIKNAMAYMNQLHARRVTISEDAHRRMRSIYIAIAQRTLREVTKEDEDRFKQVGMLDGF